MLFKMHVRILTNAYVGGGGGGGGKCCNFNLHEQGTWDPPRHSSSSSLPFIASHKSPAQNVAFSDFWCLCLTDACKEQLVLQDNRAVNKSREQKLARHDLVCADRFLRGKEIPARRNMRLLPVVCNRSVYHPFYCLV